MREITRGEGVVSIRARDQLRLTRAEAPVEQLASIADPDRLAAAVLRDQQLAGGPSSARR